MRSFRGIATRWPLSALCAAVLVIVTGLAFVPVCSAAQMEATGVAVVNFRNLSKVAETAFAGMGTEAVVVELMRTGSYDVASADAVRGTLEKVGYKAKEDSATSVVLTPSMLQRLGQEMQVKNVVDGDVASIEVNKAKKTAKVLLAVRVLDVESGEWINGASEVGTSRARIGYTGNDTDTDLISEAISDAAHKCVSTIVSYTIPEGTILANVGTKEVLLNKGVSDGVKPGMLMSVLRVSDAGKDELVAKVRVTTITDTDSRAVIEETGRGIKPGDHVRAIYEPRVNKNGVAVDERRSDSGKRISKARNLLWGVVGLVGLWALSNHGGEHAESVPSAIVVAGANGDIPTYSGNIPSNMIAWNTMNGLREGDVVEYHIWRDSFGSLFGEGSDVVNTGLVLNPDEVTALPLKGNVLGSFDHMTVDDYVSREFDYSFPSDDHTSLEDGTATGIPAPEIGKAHKYWVSCVYKRRASSSAQSPFTEESYWESQPAYCGTATAVPQPILSSPGSILGTESVDLSEITFVWKGSLGANQYVIEVSSDPQFSRSKTWVSAPFYQITPIDGMEISKTFAGTMALSLASELKNLPAGTMLYWRVGAKNTQDSPGPIPAGPSPEKSGAKNTRYIYTAPDAIYSFQILGGDVPPTPDEGGTTTPAN